MAATGNYLEDYLNTVSDVPIEMKRKFELIRELDKRVHSMQADLSNRVRKYLKHLHSSIQTGGQPDSTALSTIRSMQAECVKLSDEKVALAAQCYELVDKHIRDLDEQLGKLSEELGGGADDVGKGRGSDGASSARKRVETMKDMPVDPNEPVYCLCKRVSFGQMIACEDPDCPIEWFHFECVNLKEQPKVWYCPLCRNKRH